MNACGVLFQMLVVLGVLFLVCSYKIISICKSYSWGSVNSTSHDGGGVTDHKFTMKILHIVFQKPKQRKSLALEIGQNTALIS